MADTASQILPNGNGSNPMDGANPIDDRHCTATNRRGSRCERFPVPGATVCVMHGGKAPQVARKAAERLAEARDAALLAFYAKVEDDAVDPKTLLDAVIRLSETSETLSGRVAKRTETLTETPTADDLAGMLDELAERRRTA